MSDAGTVQTSAPSSRTRVVRASLLPRLALGLSLIGLAACGDDDTDGGVTRPRRDAGGGSEKDAALGGDGATGDAASDGAAGDDDAGSKPDAAVVDGCYRADDESAFEVAIPFSDEGGFGLTPGTSGFGVAYWNDLEACNSLWGLPVQGTGDVAAPVALLGDCPTIRELSLIRTEQGYQLVWVDNTAESGAELQSMQLNTALSERIGPVRTTLTNNTFVERHPVLASLDSVPFVAFIATDPESRKARILGRRLDGESEVRELVPEALGHDPQRLALTRIGANHALVAWTDAATDKSGVWIQRIDLLGTRSGDPVRVSPEGAVGHAVDFATRELTEGGAILYSISLGGANFEVRFLRLDATGTSVGDEVKVVGAPLQGGDASFTRVGGGYVVAYRALPGGVISAPQIRFTTITKEGTLTRTKAGELVSYPLAESGSGGGRITLRLSNDGHLLAGFVDGDETMMKLRIVRQRLDCND